MAITDTRQFPLSEEMREDLLMILTPLAFMAGEFSQPAHEDGWVIASRGRRTITVGDLRAARRVRGELLKLALKREAK